METKLYTNDLKTILESLIQEMAKKNMLTGLDVLDNEGNVKSELMDALATKLDGKLTFEDLKNDQTIQKMLGLVIISQAISNKFPQYQFNFQNFFDENLVLQDTKRDLKIELKKLFLAMNELVEMDKKPRPQHKLDEKKIDDYVEKLSEQIIDDYSKKDKNKLCQNDLLTDTVAELYLRTLNGGDSPNKAGEVNYPINGPILGNLIGIPTQSVQTTSKETRTAMGDQGTYNPDKENRAPEAFALLGAISQGLSLVTGVGNTPRLTPHQSE